MYQDTVTLFTRQENREGDKWYATVLRNVHLIVDRAALIAKYGPDAQDAASLHVRCQMIDGDVWIGSKQWLPPKAWTQANDPENTVTFTDGTRFDFFVKGEYEGVFSDADYNGGFYAHMNRTHDFVFAVTAVGGPYKLIPHFEIMGK